MLTRPCGFLVTPPAAGTAPTMSDSSDEERTKRNFTMASSDSSSDDEQVKSVAWAVHIDGLPRRSCGGAQATPQGPSQSNRRVYVSHGANLGSSPTRSASSAQRV